jgi:hypothetical protein
MLLVSGLSFRDGTKDLMPTPSLDRGVTRPYSLCSVAYCAEMLCPFNSHVAAPLSFRDVQILLSAPWTLRVGPCRYRRASTGPEARLKFEAELAALVSGCQALIVVVILFALAGCASTMPPTAAFDTTKQYPPVGLVVNDGVVKVLRYSTGRSKMTTVDPTSAIIKEELVHTGAFERVDLNNPYHEVVVSMDFMRRSTDDNFVKGLLAGGSLTLIPTTTEFLTKASVSVRVRAEVVKTYTYEFKDRQRVFMFDASHHGPREAARAVWSLFLSQAQKDRVFEDLVPTSLMRQRPGEVR